MIVKEGKDQLSNIEHLEINMKESLNFNYTITMMT